jgi:hypothetical protein
MKIKEVIAEGLQDWLDDRKEKKEEKMLSQVRAGLPATALKQFQKELKESNIDINNPGQTDLVSLIQNFALNYFGVGDNKYQFQLEEKIAAVIKEKIAKIPLPSAVNVAAIKAYFTDANNARTAELNKLENSIKTRNLAAQPEPSQNTSNTTTNTATNVANTTVPPAADGMINTLTINTQGGMRKFFIGQRDKTERWFEYVGNDWPNEIEMSLLVNDDATIDYLSAQVADGNLKQEPYS